MACYSPLTAYQYTWWQGGKLHKGISFKEDSESERKLSLPCGQCVGCRLERSRQWAIRCMHEASLHEENCFITLTYNNENCPKDMSLHYEEYQLFMKRLRKAFPGKNIKFYMAGEYGELFDRPHFHAILFGVDFHDRKYFKTTGSGAKLDRSDILERIWDKGYSTVGNVTFESSAYVARYIMKKMTGKARLDENGNWIDPLQHYKYCDLETGELIQRKPEFNKMSLKAPHGSPPGTPGGIGAGWYDKFKDDVYPHDYVVVNGKKCRPPRYYDKIYQKFQPEDFEMLQFARELEGRSHSADNTPERLKVKEKVARARLSKLKRSID